MTRTGIESASFQPITAPDAAVREPGPSATLLDATAVDHGSRSDAAARATPVTSAIPAFLETIGRLAAEATARGEIDRAMELLAQAARVAAATGTTSNPKTTKEDDR
ncbi:MAG: hypothetical protein WCC48_13405 [Anaeromyxobacteraceae bacterium]